MRYVDGVEKTFDDLNRIYNNNLLFLESLHDDSELYEFICNHLQELTHEYRSFVAKNNIPLDRIPNNIRTLVFESDKNLDPKK